MRTIPKPAIFSILILVFLFQSQFVALAAESDNPLIEPYEITEYTELTDNFINILLLGIDFGTDGLYGSFKKNKEISECHTDAVMVVAINLDDKRIDLISLPRDTVTYVPEVRGIYKLNAAVNCAETLEEGLQRTKNTAEWLLGDIKIDYYFAVDMNTMVALGDAIGGVDIELEMSYRGNNDKWYDAGMQHLDGIGMLDYVQARTNATVNYTDIGRTNRQRQMMMAIFQKLRSDESMIWNLFETATTQYEGFFTDITTAVIVQLALTLPAILSVDEQDIGTHVFSGPYLGTLGWNFTFTDQEHRISVINEVYGITVKPISFVSREYAQWLLDTGFSSVHYISVANEFIGKVGDPAVETLTSEQAEVYSAFQIAFQDAVNTFTAASNSMSGSDTQAMEEARKALREATDACAYSLEYTINLPWAHNREYWYSDLYINEYQLDWR